MAASVQVDVSESVDVERMVRTTVESFGRIDVLFNNAGVNFPATPSWTSPRRRGSGVSTSISRV